MAGVVLNYTTSVKAEKTVQEIQTLLVKHGVERLMIEYADGRPSGISFVAKTEWGEQGFRLPVNVDAMHALLKAEKRAGRLPSISVPQANDRAHAERVAWRVVAEWLKAQMTLIASRMVSLDQVMLPYLVQGDGRMLYVTYREKAMKELTQGEGD